MGTEVLRPHDCLIDRIRGPPAMVYPRRRNAYSNNYHFNSHPTKPSQSKPAPVRSDYKKKTSESSPAISRRFSSDDLRQTKQSHNHHQNQPAMGQITILKRGQPLDLNPQAPKASSRNHFIVSGTGRLGPDPAVLKKQIRIKDPKMEGRSRSMSPKLVAGGAPDVYAGSAFSVSPAPESLPLPTFSTKKQVSMTVDDSATRDLRRLLRLD